MKRVLLSMALTATLLLSNVQVFADVAFDYEPNNSPDSAFEINGDSTILSTVAGADDVDYFKFNINGTVDTVISLVSPQGLDYDIKLYDADFNELGSSELATGSTDTINKKSLKAGTYSIKVYCFDKKYSTSAYTLSLKSTDVKGINKTGYKGMPESDVENTTMDNALEVNKNTVFMAKIGGFNENRYYEIIFDSPSDLDIGMNPPEGVDLDIKLYDSKGLETGSSTAKNGEERITKSNLSPGTYFLKVYGSYFDYSSNTYKVQIKTSKAGTGQTETQSDDTYKAKTSLPRALLLYVGPGQPEFTDKDIKKMLVDDPINTKEFVITENGAQYNTYINSEGKLSDIITPEKINALTIDKIDSTGNLDSIKSDYLNFYKNIEKSNSLDYFSDKAVNLALKLIKADPDVKIYIAIPGVNFHAMTDEYIEPVKEKLMKGIKSKLDKVNLTYWEKNIAGYYFSTEGIPYYYSWFKPDKTIDFNNPVVKAMSSLSNEIHQVYNKKFIWIPYYGSSLEMDEYYNKNQFVRAGYIANRTDIFDYVIMQPTYYFYADYKNIPNIKASIENNAVLGPDQGIIGGIKSSKTIIGAEIEIDKNYASASATAKGYQNRYKEYANAFKDSKAKYPIAFYAGTRDDIFTDAVYIEIKNFFQASDK